jgi:hypothetical protein
MHLLTPLSTIPAALAPAALKGTAVVISLYLALLPLG